jgi:hypothetical protein
MFLRAESVRKRGQTNANTGEPGEVLVAEGASRGARKRAQRRSARHAAMAE